TTNGNSKVTVNSGGSLTIGAGSSTIGAAVTVASGATLTVGTGANVFINTGVTITDSGTLNVTSAASVVAQDTQNRVPEGFAVTSGGVLSATGTSFTRTGSGVVSTISVAAGGHMTASNCTFAFSNVTLANGSVLNSGEITGNGFDTTLSVPAT